MRPTVSVIVPCYNCEGTVEKTLSSLAAQTLAGMELIVINDGSKDHTWDVLCAYKEAHPELDLKLFTKENEGIAATRTFGVDHVSGEYFGFLDSDDYTEKTMFEDLYRKAKDEDLEVVVSDFDWVSSSGRKRQKEGPYACGPDMMVHLFAVLWNKIYKTDFIRSLDVTFPRGDRYEDACYLYCLTPHIHKLGFVDNAYVSYIQQEKSITHTNNDQVMNMIHVFEIITDYYRTHGFYDTYHDALEYIHIRFFLGNNFLRALQIEDPAMSRQAVMTGWKRLNQEFPEWHHNPYLKSEGGLKNRYYALVHDWNLPFFMWFFRHFYKGNL